MKSRDQRQYHQDGAASDELMETVTPRKGDPEALRCRRAGINLNLRGK